MSNKSAADNMPLDEATEFLVRGHKAIFNQNPSKKSLIRHIKRLDKELKASRAQQESVPNVGEMADILGEELWRTQAVYLTHVTLVNMVRKMLTDVPTLEAVQGGGMPDLTSTIVNDCCWTFADAMPHTLPTPIFNNLKPALYEALKQYHNALLTASTPQPAPSAVPEGYVAIGESNLGARREYGETADEASEKMERPGFYTYEIKELYASQPAEQPECGCCGQTVKCDDDCDAGVIGKAKQNPAPDVSELVGLLEHARCNTCDGSGALYDGHGQVRQCQWCHDRSAALAAHRKATGAQP